MKRNTFQGNKSPCDSDCLFNNSEEKKGQKKILLENGPTKRDKEKGRRHSVDQIDHSWTSVKFWYEPSDG